MAGSGVAVVVFAAFGVMSQAVLVCFFIARRWWAPRLRTLRLACACLCWPWTAAWTLASGRRRVLETLGGSAADGGVGAV
jgi:uncharacterized membrane protein YqjE